jgi:hypothetical protein
MARPFDFLLSELRTVYENHQELTAFAPFCQDVTTQKIEHYYVDKDWHVKKMNFLTGNISHFARLWWQQEPKRVDAKPINIPRSGKIF